LEYTPDLIPTGYFQFPIMPGQQNFLAGSMGEIRPNHFHGGIDIKTNQVIGLPVFAAADGYISRIEVSTYGYGNMLYLTHPNGLVTTYAHLETFSPAIADYVLHKHYEQESFELRLNIPKDMFPIRKGDELAKSGNTGGSAGPHLHFEVRDEKNNLLNPLKYSFAEIKDDVPPSFSAIALKTLSIDGRVNNRFGRFEFTPVKSGAHYVLPDTLTANGLLGLEVLAYDRLSQALNKNGVQQVDILIDGKLFYNHLIDGVPFDYNRHVSWHINYENYKTTGKNFQKCYIDDGNLLPIYQTGPGRGKWRVTPGKTHQISIVLKDSHQNTTTLQFALRGEKPTYFYTPGPLVKKPDFGYEIAENILKVVANDTARVPQNVQLFVGKMRFELIPSYSQASYAVFLYDLRGGLPDSIRWNQVTKKFTQNVAVPSGSEYSFTNRYLNVIFNKNSLFDTLYLHTSYNNGIYGISSPLTPLFQAVKVTLKANEPILDKSKAAVYYLGWGNSKGFLGGTWEGDKITFSARNLGKFKIYSDSKPPTIRLLSKSPQVIRLKMGDDLSGVTSFRAELNGEFLLMKFEHKNATLTSERLNRSEPLAGDFVLRVKDAMGNEGVYRVKI
ncbi:MAG: peptidase, partial [Adhaeribacter sp.]|nr:peptidase [Adhaeribacter sp.]